MADVSASIDSVVGNILTFVVVVVRSASLIVAYLGRTEKADAQQLLIINIAAAVKLKIPMACLLINNTIVDDVVRFSTEYLSKSYGSILCTSTYGIVLLGI